jgi:hypothetical protein
VLLAKPKTPSSEPKPPTIAVGSNGQEGVFSGGVDIGARVLSGGFLTIPPPDEFAAFLAAQSFAELKAMGGHHPPPRHPKASCSTTYVLIGDMRGMNFGWSLPQSPD